MYDQDSIVISYIQHYGKGYRLEHLYIILLWPKIKIEKMLELPDCCQHG